LERIAADIPMERNNILAWRPKTASVDASEPELLWTMLKQQWQIECTLQNCGQSGWSVHVLLNGSSFFRCRFRSWEDAIEGAEDKFAELAGGGWTPVSPISNHRRR
jgi:hypothetical protein